VAPEETSLPRVKMIRTVLVTGGLAVAYSSLLVPSDFWALAMFISGLGLVLWGCYLWARNSKDAAPPGCCWGSSRLPDSSDCLSCRSRPCRTRLPALRPPRRGAWISYLGYIQQVIKSVYF